MVVLPDDMAVVKECLTRLGAELGVSPLPKLGAMIEIPAAALSAASMKPYAAFLSFGTNDLTQYTFAADRENAAVKNVRWTYHKNRGSLFPPPDMTLHVVAALRQ